MLGVGKLRITVVVLLLALGGCKKPVFKQQGPPPDVSVPSLNYPLTSFATTIRFSAFGQTLPNATVNKGYEIQLTDPNLNIQSVDSGIITAIEPGPHGGSTIHVLYKPHSVYSFVYSGITSVQVHVNDTIKGGIILGRISPTGIIDFGIVQSNSVALCPQAYGGPAFNSSIQVAIDQHNQHNADTISNSCAASSVPE